MAQIFEFIESYSSDALKIQTKKNIGLVVFEDKINGKFCLIFDVDISNKTIRYTPYNRRDPNDSQLAGLINENRDKFEKMGKIVDLMEFIKDVIPIITNYCVNSSIFVSPLWNNS